MARNVPGKRPPFGTVDQDAPTLAPPSQLANDAANRRSPTSIEHGFRGFAPLTPLPRRLMPIRILRRPTS